MTPLVLVLQLAAATVTLCNDAGLKCREADAGRSVQACWQPAMGLMRYQLWQAGTEWTPRRHGISCPSQGICCAEEMLTWNEGKTTWMVVGYNNSLEAGQPVAWSAPMTVDMQLAGRNTSAPLLPPVILDTQVARRGRIFRIE